MSVTSQTYIDNNGNVKKTSHVYSGVDHVYVNLQLQNTSTSLQPVIFNQSYENAIINTPLEYYLSIVRFSVPGALIPIFVFNQTPNYYQVNIQDSLGVDHITSVIYQEQTIPNNSYVYSYQLFIDNVNTAFATSAASAGLAAPVLMFDPATALISMAVPQAGYAVGNPPGAGAQIFFNVNLHAYFHSLELVYNNLIVPTTINFARVVVNDNGNNWLATGAVATNGVSYSPSKLPAGNYWLMTEEYPSLYDWNDIQNIVIKAVGMGIRNEFMPNVNGSLNTEPILTDFQIPVNTGPDSRSVLQYIPNGEYREIDMIQQYPLNIINLQLYWSNRAGQNFPLYLDPQAAANIKLLFRRKGAPFNVYKEIANGTYYDKDLPENVTIIGEDQPMKGGADDLDPVDSDSKDLERSIKALLPKLKLLQGPVKQGERGKERIKIKPSKYESPAVPSYIQPLSVNTPAFKAYQTSIQNQNDANKSNATELYKEKYLKTRSDEGFKMR